VDFILAFFGDLRLLLPRPTCEILLMATSFICGAVVGFEREKERKAAGLRTHILICVGSALFTVISTSPALGGHEPARIAAQIVTGVGFLGAGTILRDHHHISGLTTAATIWATSGIGLAVGAGYATAGLSLSFCVFITLVWVRRLEIKFNGPCEIQRVRVLYQPLRGKTQVRLRALLDEAKGPVVGHQIEERADGLQEIHIEYCGRHRDHRSLLGQLVEVPGVEALERISENSA
jgi:putative Mg2+ transporter-C (MgtC) family protein